jgi:hypothetical protein
MRTIKTYSNRASFYNAFVGTNAADEAITVAVGTTIADRPPPAQIRTSASTHTALTKDECRRSVRRDRGAELGVEESIGSGLG